MNALPARLSLREIQVLRLAAEGLTAKATAKLLHLSESAVNLYICHARRKLGAKTKTEAIAMLVNSDATSGNFWGGVKNTALDAPLNEHLLEMLLISHKMRQILEAIMVENVSPRSDQCIDLTTWNELVEKFLVTAARACGYSVYKNQLHAEANMSEA